jgi:hypothetical protein
LQPLPTRLQKKSRRIAGMSHVQHIQQNKKINCKWHGACSSAAAAHDGLVGKPERDWRHLHPCPGRRRACSMQLAGCWQWPTLKDQPEMGGRRSAPSLSRGRRASALRAATLPGLGRSARVVLPLDAFGHVALAAAAHRRLVAPGAHCAAAGRWLLLAAVAAALPVAVVVQA